MKKSIVSLCLIWLFLPVIVFGTQLYSKVTFRDLPDSMRGVIIKGSTISDSFLTNPSGAGWKFGDKFFDTIIATSIDGIQEAGVLYRIYYGVDTDMVWKPFNVFDTAQFKSSFWAYLKESVIVDMSAFNEAMDDAGGSDTSLIAFLRSFTSSLSGISQDVMNLNSWDPTTDGVIASTVTDKIGYFLHATERAAIKDTLQGTGSLLWAIAYYLGAPDSSTQIMYPNDGTSPKDSVRVFDKTGAHMLTIIFKHSNISTTLDSIITAHQ